MDDVTTDLLIIGAGPTGLYSAYYAGFRGMSVAVVDSLPELGGQITAMYPEKAILDVAGFPSVKGRDLVEGLVEQAATAHPTYLLDRTATTLEHGDDLGRRDQELYVEAIHELRAAHLRERDGLQRTGRLIQVADGRTGRAHFAHLQLLGCAGRVEC